jgi:hypothetical protein
MRLQYMNLPVGESSVAEGFAQILAFITKHQLAESVLSALERIMLFFPDSKYKITLHTDFEENNTTLFIIIYTQLNPKEAFHHSLEMFKDWDLIKNPDFNRFVTITTETV